MLARFSGKIDGLQGPQPGVVGGGDLPVDQRLADAAAAVAVADVDRGLGDPGVDRRGSRPARPRPSRRPAPSISATQRWSGSQVAVQGAPVGDLGLEGGVAGGDALGVDAPHVGPVARLAAARTVTSAGRSCGQHGRGPSMPMTASAACGRPVQHAGLTDTSVAVRSLRRCTNPTSASLRRWCEQVDWLIPSCSVSSPTVTARPAHGDGVQQPHPRRLGQAGEPLRVGRRVGRRELAPARRGDVGQGQARRSCRTVSTRDRWLRQSIARRYSPPRWIDDRRWRS